MTEIHASRETPDNPGTDTFEQRWQAWQAKGRARDRQTSVRGRAVVAVLALAVGATALWMVTGG